MAISVIKAWDEGPIKLGGKSGSATVNWIASTDDPDNDTREDVILAIFTYADPFYFDLTLDSVTLSERLSDNAGEAHWAVQVSYKNPETKKEKPLKQKPPGTAQPARWSIRSSGGATVTRTKSLEVVEDTAATLGWAWASDPATDPRVLKLIGLEANPEGNSASNFGITGVPVPIGKIELVVTTIRPNEDVKNNSYLVNLAEHVALKCFDVFQLPFSCLDASHAMLLQQAQAVPPRRRWRPWRQERVAEGRQSSLATGLPQRASV